MCSPAGPCFCPRGRWTRLYLAVRLAVYDLCLREHHVPLILDDALAAFDQERMERALDLLVELSREEQILFFTCQSREGAYLARTPGWSGWPWTVNCGRFADRRPGGSSLRAQAVEKVQRLFRQPARMPILSRRRAAGKSSLRSLNALPCKASRAFDPTRGGLPPPRAPPPQLERFLLYTGFLTS